MVDSLGDVVHSLETESQNAKKPFTSSLSEPLPRSQLSSDINDILNLAFDDLNAQSGTSEKSTQPERIKCYNTIIGGTNLEQGCSRLASPRTCSALRCRDCDFPVSSFQDHDWIENVEYLYLRTNMPNYEKVTEKLSRKDGTVAYACHCVSFSTDQIQAVGEKRLPWFCGGHD